MYQWTLAFITDSSSTAGWGPPWPVISNNLGPDSLYWEIPCLLFFISLDSLFLLTYFKITDHPYHHNVFFVTTDISLACLANSPHRTHYATSSPAACGCRCTWPCWLFSLWIYETPSRETLAQPLCDPPFLPSLSVIHCYVFPRPQYIVILFSISLKLECISHPDPKLETEARR